MPEWNHYIFHRGSGTYMRADECQLIITQVSPAHVDEQFLRDVGEACGPTGHICRIPIPPAYRNNED